MKTIRVILVLSATTITGCASAQHRPAITIEMAESTPGDVAYARSLAMRLARKSSSRLAASEISAVPNADFESVHVTIPPNNENFPN